MGLQWGFSGAAGIYMVEKWLLSGVAVYRSFPVLGLVGPVDRSKFGRSVCNASSRELARQHTRA